ncbi:hypothetical protein [Brevinema andersonii]|nr:hypothetical protein [Brevinema andersonii]
MATLWRSACFYYLPVLPAFLYLSRLLHFNIFLMCRISVQI